MRLLVSAYACAPNLGSEHAVGWNWVTEAARLGHEVWVMASEAHRGAIASACQADPDLGKVHFIFPVVRGWPLTPGVEPKWERTYNWLWQIQARREAKRLCRTVSFDAIHHLTWAGIRAMTYLGGLGAPLIVGPIGGGETSPHGLRDAIGRRGRLLELARDISNATATVNPLLLPGLRAAEIIFCSTRETAALLRGYRTQVFSQLALPELPQLNARSLHQPPRFLCAGRLLYWKGIHIALRAFQLAAIPGAEITIVGDGPERRRLEREFGATPGVRMINRMPQQDFLALYDTHDILLFPSLHDSGGFVPLEALARAMPVICLDLGGPRDLVTSRCGAVVSTQGRTTEQAAEAIAHEMRAMVETQDRYDELSRGARARASQFLLRDRVTQLYELSLARADVSLNPRAVAL